MNRICLWFFKHYIESWPVKNAYLTCRRDLNRIIDIGGENSTEKAKLMRILALCYTSRGQIDKILGNMK